MPTNKRIQIAMLEMSPQNKAILEFYFDRTGNGLYKVVNEDKANALIIDYDQPSAKQHVADILDNRQIPILLVSIKEQSLPSTIWLAKPLTANSLNVAAKSLLELTEEIAAKALADEADAIVMNKQVEALAEKMEAKAAIENNALEAVVSDQDVLDEFGISEENSIEESSIEDNSTKEKFVEDDVFETNLTEEDVSESDKVVETAEKDISLLGAGVSIAGVGALAATSKSHDASDSFDLLDSNDNLNIENNTDEDQNIDALVIDDENEVDNLLDSLMLEEDDKDALETTSEVSKVEESEDAFLESLELDEEPNAALEIQLDTDLNKVSETDLLLDLNTELSIDEQDTDSTNDFDELISDDTISTREAIVDVEKESVLLNEDFTIHDDINPSTENIYASTLEADFKDDEIIEKNSLEVVSNELEGLLVTPSIEFDESEKLASNETESLDNDLFDFDLKAVNEAKSTEPTSDLQDDFPGEATDGPEVGLETNVGNDLELSLLDETDNTVSAEDELDSLLEDISSSDADNNDDTTADEPPILEEVDNLESLLQEIAPEIAIAAGVTVASGAAAIADANNEVADDHDDFSDSDLQSLLNEVREEAQKPIDSQGIGANTNENSNYDPTKAEKRWMQLCGNLQAIKGQKDVTSISYELNQHLLGALLKQIVALKDKEQLYRIKYEDLIIVIDHEKNSIYCNMDVTSDEYSVLCFNKIEPEKLKIHDLDYSEERLYRSKIEKNGGRSHNMESFIWLMSLLTSRGRLPKNTNITKKVGLKAWPNLTRVESIPHAMHMAAVFSKHPGTLLEISGWLNIQQRYVFAFYNAALHLDMIELDSSKLKKPGKSLNKKGGNSGSEERGFFGRLLKRLKS